MASNYIELPIEGGSGGGVSSINTLTGALTLVGGTGITITTGVNTITIAASSSTVTSIGPVGSSPNANGGSISGNVLTLQPANATFPGVLLAADWVTFNSKQNALTIGNITDAGTDGIVITGGTGAIIGAGVTLAQHVADSTHNGYLSSTDWTTFNSKQASGNYITALTGDGTATGPGSAALTLATVNSNVGSFGSSTSIPSFTVNAKGLITAASGNVVIAPAGTLTGTTLNSTVVSSSLTSVGTIATGVWNGTAVDVAHGGTGLASGTSGGIPYYSSTTTIASTALLSQFQVLLGGGAAGAPTVVSGTGTTGQLLTSNGAGVAPTWQTNTGSTQWVTTGSDIYYNAGKVGIGTTTPATTFQVAGGNITVDSTRGLVSTNGNGTNSLVINNTQMTISIGTGSNIQIQDGVGNPKARISASSASNNYFTSGNTGIGTQAPTSLLHVSATYTNTSGAQIVSAVTPTYNEATGTASNTDFLINRTETALGSGAQRLIDAQVASTSKFFVDNKGTTSTIHLAGGSAAPTIAAGAGAGTGPTIAIAGTDLAGQITLTTGTSPSASATIATVTFNVAYTSAPYIQTSPGNANAGLAGTSFYTTSTTTTFVLSSTTAALAASTAYVFTYTAHQ